MAADVVGWRGEGGRRPGESVACESQCAQPWAWPWIPPFFPPKPGHFLNKLSSLYRRGVVGAGCCLLHLKVPRKAEDEARFRPHLYLEDLCFDFHDDDYDAPSTWQDKVARAVKALRDKSIGGGQGGTDSVIPGVGPAGPPGASRDNPRPQAPRKCENIKVVMLFKDSWSQIFD